MFQETILGGTPADTVSLTHLTLDEQLPLHLHAHGARLRRIADDSSAATKTPLEDEIERIEEILEALSAVQETKEVTE
jgi:hypothetical protein